MKKLMMVAVLLASVYAMAAVTISVSAKTVQKSGGGGTITVSGTGAWTAVADSSWITIKSGSSGDGDGKVMFTVGENTTADTRIGHINVNDSVYTITQYGYAATISPSSVTVDRNGASGTISVTTEAGITWTAKANVDWLTVSPTSGRSVGTVTYTVAAYPGVVSRSGSITIAGNTFTVTQTGVDVNIEPAIVKIGPEADILMVDITALASTKWNVTPNSSWISVLDKEQGYGDYALALAVNSNPSFAKRTGTVAIGTATLTVVQDGKETAELAIDPEYATASPSGAYGNVAVYATPDAPWIAESLTSWLTISEGREGAGNGNIKYVASPNPTLEERDGVIKITPPYKKPELDLYAGMIFELSQSRYGVSEEDATRYSSETTYLSYHKGYSAVGYGVRYAAMLPYVFNGSKSLSLTGDSLPVKDDNSFAMAFTFSVGEVGCVNRLLMMGDKSVYLDIENRLWVNDAPTTFFVDNINKNYTVAISQETDGTIFVYAGSQSDTELAKVLESRMTTIDFASPVEMSNFKFGYTTYPTVGYLGDGKLVDIRMWLRSLTSNECIQLNSLTMLHDASPAYVPSDITKWWYFPMDGNAYYATESAAYNLPRKITLPGMPSDTYTHNVSLNGLSKTKNRFGFEGKAVESEGDGMFFMPRWRYQQSSSSYKNMSISMWVKVDSLPSSEMKIVKKTSSDTKDRRSDMNLVLDPEGRIGIDINGVQTKFSTYEIPVGEWVMLSMLGKSQKSVAVYCDDIEIGNVNCSNSLGDFHDSSSYLTYSLTIGGHNGSIDDLVIYDGLLTATDVRALYNAGKPNIVYHNVSQGVQNAKLSETNMVVAAAGVNSSVQLTLAQNVNWTARSNCDWIHITSDTEGAGSTTIAFTVDSTPYVVNRKGTLMIAGITLTIEQVGLEAYVECEKTFFDSVESDIGFISVYTEGAGQWTAVSNDDWIQIDPDTEEGNGAGDCWFFIDDYPLTTQSRTGSITIAGKTVYITQSGYKLSIDPAIAEVGSNAGAGEIGVAASIDQVWDVITDCDWISIVNGRNGIGNGKVQYQFTDNTTGETRTGTIIIGGQKYTLTQRTTLPLTTAAIGGGSISGSGNYNQGSTVTLTATPEPGYVFSHWQGDAVGVSNLVTVAMDIAKNVSAVFIPESAAEQLAAAKAAQGGFYTRDQIHALEVGNLVFDVDSSGTARVGVQLMETSDLSDPNSWQPVSLSSGNLDIGSDGTVGMKVPATGNAKFFKVVVPKK